MMAVSAARIWAQPIPTTPPAPAAPATNGVGPKIQFEKTQYDFGRVRSGEPVRYTYYFTNTGDQIVQIKSVQPQCGCTMAGDWTKEVEPGKSGKIPVQFNSTGYNAPVLKQVTVTCNVATQAVVVLQLKGTVYKQIDMNPPYVALTVPADGSSANATVTITNNSDEQLEISAPESNNKSIIAMLVTNAPGKGFQLMIRTADPLTMGSSAAQISMKTSLTNMPVLTEQVVLNVQPPIFWAPQHISVQPAPLQNGVTNSITIQNNSTNTLSLSEAKVNYPGVDVQIQEMDPGRKFTALVAFPSTFELAPGQQVELTIKSSNPKMPLLKVPLTQIQRAARPVPAPGAPSAAAARTLTPPTPPPLPPSQ